MHRESGKQISSVSWWQSNHCSKIPNINYTFQITASILIYSNQRESIIFAIQCQNPDQTRNIQVSELNHRFQTVGFQVLAVLTYISPLLPHSQFFSKTKSISFHSFKLLFSVHLTPIYFILLISILDSLYNLPCSFLMASGPVLMTALISKISIISPHWTYKYASVFVVNKRPFLALISFSSGSISSLFLLVLLYPYSTITVISL